MTETTPEPSNISTAPVETDVLPKILEVAIFSNLAIVNAPSAIEIVIVLWCPAIFHYFNL
jgi:hypothetical protein